MAGNTQGLHFISGDPSEFETKTRLFLNSAGSIGINTSNPRQKLHLDNGYMFVRGNTAPQVRINAAINDTSSTRFTFGLATGANNFFNGAQALDGCVAAPSTGRLLFGVGQDAELFILNSGDISINRASQLGNAKLSLQCDPAQEGIAVNLNQSSGISTAFAIWNTGGEIFNLSQDTDSTPDLIFKIKGSGESAPVEKVRITSAGQVAIGTDIVPSYGTLFVGVHTNTNAYTTAPTVRFAVESPSTLGDASSVHIGQRAGGSADPAIIFHRRTGSTAWQSWSSRIHQGLEKLHFGFSSFAMPGSHSYSDVMVLKRNTGVGIGTDDPQGELHILNSDPSIRLQHNNGTNIFSQLSLIHI